MKPASWLLSLIITCLALPTASQAQESLDPALPEYTKVSGLYGNLSSVGSDTLANLMTLWAEQFMRIYPGVNVQIQGAGSSTAPTALNQGTSNLGPMSRLMKDSEIEVFELRYGYRPTAIAIAIDALAIFVHQDNPLEGLTLPQLDALFSSTLNCGAPGSIEYWGQLDLTGSWASREIQLYGRNSVSGTYVYFKQIALCQGDFQNQVNELPGSASVVQAVSTSVNGMGYSGIGFATSSVRSIPLARSPSSPFVEATMENAANGSYPLARHLYVYVNIPPDGKMDPVTRQFLLLVLSRQGQETVLKSGQVPLPAEVAVNELRKLGSEGKSGSE